MAEIDGIEEAYSAIETGQVIAGAPRVIYYCRTCTEEMYAALAG